MASWYDFAKAIGELGEATGSSITLVWGTNLHRRCPTPARRPSYSLLDCTATRAQLELASQHWRDALSDTFLHNKGDLHQLIKAT